MELKTKLESTIAIPADVQKSFTDTACAFMAGTNAAEIKIEYKMKDGVLTKAEFTTTGKPVDGATKMATLLNEQLKKLINGGGKDEKTECKLVYKI